MEHLLLCREVYRHLIDLELHRVQASEHSVTPLPFNLPILLKQLERYIIWTARHTNVIEMPGVRRELTAGKNGDGA